MKNIFEVLRFTDVVEVVVPKLKKGFFTRPKGRPNIAMIYKPSGLTIYHCKGHDIVSDANNIILMPANIAYSFDCVEEGYAYRLELESIGSIDDFYSFPCDKNIEEQFKKISEIYTIINIDKYLLLSDLYKIISYIVNRQKSKDTNKHKIFEYAIKYIQANYKSQINFDEEIASKLKISVVYLRKCFYEFADMPIKQFVIEYRINISKRLLISGRPEKNIYKLVGYSSISAFSREFKKRTGQTPREFKNLII